MPAQATPLPTVNTEYIYGSDDIFPDLPGLTWNRVKTPIWSSAIHQTANGKEVRGAFWTYPRWQFTLTYELLRDNLVNGVNELKTLMGFFCKRQGAFVNFYYKDPDDYIVSGQTLGTGDNVTARFQLCRNMGGFVEPIQNIVSGTSTIYFNGVTTTNYAIDNSGVVTFSPVPSLGALITADFQFYYKCRFLLDSSEFSQFMRQLWENKKVELISLK